MVVEKWKGPGGGQGQSKIWVQCLSSHIAMYFAPSLLEVGHLGQMSHPQGSSCLPEVL